MTPRLSGHICIFGLVFLVLQFLLGIARKWSREQFAILPVKPRSHVGFFIYISSASDGSRPSDKGGGGSVWSKNKGGGLPGTLLWIHH